MRLTNSQYGFVLSTPGLLVVVALVLFPVITLFATSLLQYTSTKPIIFFGLKNYSYILQDRVFWLALATIFHWLIFVVPWLWLALGWIAPHGWPVWPLILVGLGVGIRMLTAAVTRQRLGDALLMPLSAILMTRIAIQAVWWRWRYGGPLWKGRTIGLQSLKKI